MEGEVGAEQREEEEKRERKQLLKRKYPGCPWRVNYPNAIQASRGK